MAICRLQTRKRRLRLRLRLPNLQQRLPRPRPSHLAEPRRRPGDCMGACPASRLQISPRYEHPSCSIDIDRTESHRHSTRFRLLECCGPCRSHGNRLNQQRPGSTSKRRMPNVTLHRPPARPPARPLTPGPPPPLTLPFPSIHPTLGSHTPAPYPVPPGRPPSGSPISVHGACRHQHTHASAHSLACTHAWTNAYNDSRADTASHGYDGPYLCRTD